MTLITLLTPFVPEGKRAVERIFGCNYGLYPMPNIFNLYAASSLEAAGFEVKLIDCPLEEWSETQFRDFIERDNSETFVIYSTLLAKVMDQAAHKVVREIRPDVPMIYIGPAPTDDPPFFLVDEQSYIIRGEPELTLIELAKVLPVNSENRDHILKDIPGLSWLKDGEIINNPSGGVIENLDVLPHPSRYLVNAGDYFSPKFGVSPVTVMLSSRGCSAKCIYCVPCSLSFARELEFKKTNPKKPPVRIRSVDNVIEEIRLIAEDGYKAVSIIDDQYLWGEERTRAIGEEFKRNGIVYGCLARADMVTDGIAKALKETGCKFIDLGVESLKPEILEYIKKGVTVEETENAIRVLKKHKVFIKANVLLGSSPLESRESIEYTIKRLIQLDVDAIMVGATNPFPGTDFYLLAKENKWFIKDDYYPSDSAREWVMEYPHFTREDMEKMLKWSNRRFFFRTRFFLKQVHRLKNPSDFIKTVKTFFKKLNWVWEK